MSTPPPTMTLDVDVTNPGQFLACCGVLELASRVDPTSLGWFAPPQFKITCGCESVLDRFLHSSILPIESGKRPLIKENGKPEESPAVLVGNPFELVLDWWTDEDAADAGFKTWTAGMTVMGFLGVSPNDSRGGVAQSTGMRRHMGEDLAAGQRLLQTARPITDPMPFNFDSRSSRNNALDIGFVGQLAFAFSPSVEVLALIGLQRFRPRVVSRWRHNCYCTWSSPLPAPVAAPVASGAIRSLVLQEYGFSVIPRDRQGRYKLFGPARRKELT